MAQKLFLVVASPMISLKLGLNGDKKEVTPADVVALINDRDKTVLIKDLTDNQIDEVLRLLGIEALPREVTSREFRTKPGPGDNVVTVLLPAAPRPRSARAAKAMEKVAAPETPAQPKFFLYEFAEES